jgi:4-amino-4-deoxy-L-arabinose transferase-like glycosyltransferase
VSRGWWAPDEPRYAEVAREAFNGGGALVMHLCGEVYPDKPPLLFWIAGALGALTDWNEAAMRLVSILATLGTALGTGVLARRWWGEREAAMAPGIFLGMALVMELGGRLQIDPLLAFLTTTALVLLDSPTRSASRVRLAWLLVGFAMLAKGPVALVVVALVLLAWKWVTGARRSADLPALQPAHPTVDRLSILLLFAPVLAWAGAAILLEPDLVRPLLFDQHAGRVTSGSAAPHARPWYNHLVSVPALVLPWTGLVVAGLVAAGRAARRRPGTDATGGDPGLVRAALWFGVLLVFFSAIPPKRNLYLLPAYPAAALLAARAWTGLGASPGRRLAGAVRASVPGLQVAVGAVVLLAASLLLSGTGLFDPLRERALEVPDLDLEITALRLVPGAAILLVGGLLGWRAVKGDALDAARRSLFSSWGLGAAALLLPLFAALDPVKSSERLSHRVESLAESLDAGPVPFFSVRPEGPRYYARLDAVYADGLHPEQGAATGSTDELLEAWRRSLEASHRGHLAVLDRRVWSRIGEAERAHWPVLLEDRLGSRELVVVGAPARDPRGGHRGSPH